MLTKLKEEEDEIVGTVPILLCSPQNMTAKMILRKFEKVYVDKTKKDEIVGTLSILLSSPQNMTAKMVY